MLSTRYHLSTIVAIFFALGIGILLGGTLGQQWLSERQQILVERLEKRYEEAQNRSRQLEKRIGTLQSAIRAEAKQNRELLRNLVKHQLPGRHILLVGGDRKNAESLAEAIRWAGGSVSHAPDWPGRTGGADAIVLLGEVPATEEWETRVLKRLGDGSPVPVIVQVVNRKRGEMTRRFGETPIHSFVGEIAGRPLTAYALIQFLHSAIFGKKGPVHEVQSDG